MQPCRKDTDVLRAVAATVEEAGAGEPGALRWFVANARAYVSLMHDHLRKEDYRLFPAAGRDLSRADQRELLDGFTRLEAGGGEGVSEHLLRAADELPARWNVLGGFDTRFRTTNVIALNTEQDFVVP